MNSRAIAEARGRRAETLAAWWLMLKGYRIVARRARCSRGEVDLIARRGRTVAFVEVKQRHTVEAARRALDERALRRVAAAVEVLAPRHAKPGDSIRVDAVFVARNRLPHHVENIWHG